MPIFALFERAVRLDSRLKMPYAMRALLLAGTLLMVVSGQLASLAVAAPGKVLFGSLVGLNALFILVACIPIFVGCIAEEKEEQMLGLLRMTHLNAGSILLGKACSRFVMVVLIMASQLPFFLMTITLGGVGMAQLRAAIVALAGILVLVAGVAVLWSVICQRGSVAAFLSFIHLLAMFSLPAVLGGLAGIVASQPMLAEDPLLAPWIYDASVFLQYLSSMSPLSHLMAVMATGYARTPFTGSFFACLVVAALCFCLAWLLFDRVTRKPTDVAPARTVSLRKGRLPFMSPERTWTSAVFWKDFFFDTGGKAPMILKTFAGLIAIAIDLESRGLMASPISGLLGLWIACEISIHASRLFSLEIQQQTLNALYTLPEEWSQICAQKIKSRLLAASPLIMAWTALLVIGMVRNPESWYRVFEPLGAGSKLLLFAYVSCYISFRMRWGAWLVALPLVTIVSSILMAIAYGVTMPFAASAMTTDPFAYMAVVAAISGGGHLAACLVMHRLVRARLRDTIETG
ncbi:MAG: hypothetical protein ACI8W8_000184 [Rhodothermales bacterium]|jgi:hypothetical protein